ncbi:putative nicotinate-nucleotide adenylyltransferase [Bienertia sinuspersici]
MTGWLTGKSIIISNQPYFFKKAELFPGSAFVVGADTVVRLINQNVHLYGFAYIMQVLEDIDVPDILKDMFIPIPADKFRMDISSTELRERLQM